MHFKINKRTIAVIAALSLFSSGMAIADSEEEDQEGAEEEGFKITIVSATKRNESVQDVPIAINVLDGDDLNKMGVFGSDDLISIFTNISLKKSSPINSGFSIRGVGTDNIHPVAQQAVGQYFDDVGLSSPYTSGLALYDMERVEVLRGPQNTLFGRNTTGGAVNFISRKPEVNGDLNGFARVNIGNEGRQDFVGAVGIPVGENFAVRLSAQTLNRDGVFNNLFDGRKLGSIEKHSGRFQLAWEPSDKTHVLASIMSGVSRGNLTPIKGNGVFAANGVDPCPVLDTGASQFAGITGCLTIVPTSGELVSISTSDWNDVYTTAPSRADVDSTISSLKVNHEFNEVTFTSISSYETINVEQFMVDNTGAPFMGFFGGVDSEWNVFSQEFRLTSSADSEFRWIAGTYYSTEDDLLSTTVRNGAGAPVLPPLLTSLTVLPSVDLDQDVELWSAYGQIDYDFTDKLTLNAGLRFTSDDKKADSSVRNMFGTVDGTATGERLPDSFEAPLSFRRLITDAPGVGACPGLPCKTTVPVEQTLREWGGKIGLDYKFSEEVMGYTSFSHGFKSGAFDSRALAAFSGNADKPVGPEFLDAYELGIKSTLLDDTVILNASIFYYEWEDMQVFDSDPETGFPAFLNVPLTEITGLEIDAQWKPGNGWYLKTGLGFLDPEVVKTGGLLTVKKGATVSATPDFTASGLISKEVEVGDYLIALQTDFKYQGEMTSTQSGDPNSVIDAELFINARVSIYFGQDDQYQLTIWGENLTEVKTCYDINDIGALTFANVCTPNEGIAFYGITLETSF